MIDVCVQDFEREEELEPEVEPNAGAWSRVDVNNEKPADLVAGTLHCDCDTITY